MNQHLNMLEVIQRGTLRPETLPCPFCGHDIPLASKPIGKQFINYIAGCENEDCDAQPQVSGETPEEAMRKWNTRHG